MTCLMALPVFAVAALGAGLIGYRWGREDGFAAARRAEAREGWADE